MTGSNGPYDTHEVFNQPPPLTDYDVFETDRCLTQALEREGAGWAHDRLSALGRRAGAHDTQALARQAHVNPPVPRSSFGNGAFPTWTDPA